MGKGRAVEPRGAATADLVPGVEGLVEIGRGGFSVVYRGHQADLDRDVAVKVVSSYDTAEEALERWRREVTAMARLSNHPNIVAVYAGGVTVDGAPYLVMPYVPGGSLRDRIRRGGPLPPDEVATVGAKLAGALASAHAAGVLHRDVKPENVLLSPYGEPQLADFGIARLLDATATATGKIHATIQYAAPEVLAGERATEASDVYGLGATLYACVAGEPPFASRDGESLAGVVGRIATQPPPSLVERGVPAPLTAVLEHALAKTPEERIATADELRRRLEEAREQLSGTEPPATVAAPAATVVRELVGRTAAIPVAEVTPRRAPAPPSPGPRRPVAAPRRSLLATAVGVLVALVVATLIALGIVAANRDDDTVSASSTSSTPDTAAAGAATTVAPTSTTAASTATAADPSGAIETMASSYFDAIAGDDFNRAYAMLSPGFQAIQSRQDFAAFWGGFDSVEVVGPITADEATRRAIVPLRLDGSREDYTLTFVADGDGWRIDGPRPG
jgi:serine/threonine-protein kinase PknK